MKTMEEIPEGSFVCELTGQYVDLKKKSTTEKLKKFCFDSDKDDVTFTDFYQNRLMPIALWDPLCASTIIRSAKSCDSSSSISRLESDSSRSIQIISHPDVLSNSQSSSSSSSSSSSNSSSTSLSISALKPPMGSVLDLTSCVTDNVMDDTVCGDGNGDRNRDGEGDGDNLINTRENVTVSLDHINQTIDLLGQSTVLTVDQLENHPSKKSDHESLETEEEVSRNCSPIVCLDCSHFGNIGRFIRHKRRKSSKKVAILGSSLSTVTATLAGGPKPMLLRRLVYTDSSDRRYPKLALFAAQKIPANTELFL